MHLGSVETHGGSERSTPPPPPIQDPGPSGAGTGVVGAPDLLGLPVNHQLPFVGQIEATHVATLVG